MSRKPADTNESSGSYDDADDYGPDFFPDVGDVVWDDEVKLSKRGKRGKRGMPEEEEPREFPKILIIGIIVLVIVIPAGIMLYDAANNALPSPKHYSGSPDVYEAAIQKADDEGVIARSYHDAALINFSRGQYDAAIDLMTLAADHSQRSMDGYLAAVREMKEDYDYANYSSEGALFMHKAELMYVEAFRSYKSGDVDNASVYWDEAKYYVGLAEDHRVIRD